MMEGAGENDGEARRRPSERKFGGYQDCEQWHWLCPSPLDYARSVGDPVITRVSILTFNEQPNH